MRSRVLLLALACACALTALCAAQSTPTLSPTDLDHLAHREFEVMFSPRNDEWPAPYGSAQSFISCLKYQMSPISYDVKDYVNVSYTRLFSTIVVEVNATMCPWTTDTDRFYTCNASRIAYDYYASFAAGTAYCINGYNITNQQYGYKPVVVPDYLHHSLEPNTIIMNVMGGIGALLSVVQIAYGVYHFDNIITALFTLGSSDERHD